MVINESKEKEIKNSYILIEVDNSLYGIDTLNVHEVVELPALQMSCETSPYISGFVNIRGETIIVFDLIACLGFRSRTYSLRDLLVIVKNEQNIFGLVIPEIYDLGTLEAKRPLQGAVFNQANPIFPFTSFTAHFDDRIVFLIDPNALEKHFLSISSDALKSFTSKPDTKTHEKFPSDPEVKRIFLERAARLFKEAQVVENQPIKSTLLIVFQLKGERYAVEALKEFCPIKDFTSIPGSPAHIFGFFNLRGQVIPIIDILHVLQGTKNDISDSSKILIVDFKGSIVGALVDDVVNLIFSSPADYRSVPISVKIISEEYIKSTVKYEKDVIPVLDFKKIIGAVYPSSAPIEFTPEGKR